MTRSVLRFRDQEAAKRAADSILEVESVREEPLPPPAEEVMAEMRLGLPKLATLWLTLVVVVAVWVFPRTLYLGTFIAALLFLVFLPVSVWLRITRGTVPVWLRQEGNVLWLRTMDGSGPLVPTKVELKDSTSFLLRMRRRPIDLKFRNSDEAGKAIRLLKANYTELEVNYENTTSM